MKSNEKKKSKIRNQKPKINTKQTNKKVANT